MKRIMLLAVITGALMVPATAGASGGIGAGGVPACALATFNVGPQAFGSIRSVGAYPGPPGPMAGPNSMIDWSQVQEGSKNNGTALIGLCQTV